MKYDGLGYLKEKKEIGVSLSLLWWNYSADSSVNGVSPSTTGSSSGVTVEASACCGTAASATIEKEK